MLTYFTKNWRLLLLWIVTAGLAMLELMTFNISSVIGSIKIVARTPAGDNGSNVSQRVNNKFNETDGIVTQVPWTSSHPLWCSGRGNQTQNLTDGKYFLTAVVMFRIYASDFNKLTTRELVQWLQYLSYAGVEHVYAYDSFLYKNESQRENLRCFVENGYITYIDWSHKALPDITKRPDFAQQPAYQHCLDNFGHQFVWQTSIDIDEYPYCSTDRSPGFLSRAVKEIKQKQKPNLGRIFMQNYVFLGKSLNVSEHPLLIDRLWRRTTKPFDPNQRVKPIFLSKAVYKPMVHKPMLRGGYVSYTAEHKMLRMNHYHGERHYKTATEEDQGMETAVSALEKCVKGCAVGCC